MTAVRSATPRSDSSPRRPPVRLRIAPRRRARRDLGWRATVVLCIVGGFAAMIASVAIQGQRIALQEEADKVAARTAAAEDRNRDLRIEVIQAESPAHVLDVARAAGLIEPGPIAVVPAAVAAPATTAPAASPGGSTSGSSQSAARSDVSPSTLVGPKAADAG